MVYRGAACGKWDINGKYEEYEKGEPYWLSLFKKFSMAFFVF